MRKPHAFLALLALAGMAWGQSAPEAATEPAPKPESVTLAGKITGGGALGRVVAVDRQWADVLKVSKEEAKDEFVYPASLTDKAWTFSVPKLLPGRTYDLIVWTTTKDGAAVRWEGVNMDYHRPILPDKPLEAEDRKWIEDFLRETPQFYDKCRPLWMAADHKHATVLVELARTNGFFSSKNDEVIYRAELWYFENLFGGWAKDKNTERVVSRWRGAGEKLPAWQYVPALGGITIKADGTYDAINVTLPDAPDAKRGTTGGLKR